MDTKSIKSEIYQKLEQLDKQSLNEVNEMVTAYLKKKDIERWGELSHDQQNGILLAIESIKNGKEIKHEEIIEKYRRKYAEK